MSADVTLPWFRGRYGAVLGRYGSMLRLGLGMGGKDGDGCGGDCEVRSITGFTSMVSVVGCETEAGVKKEGLQSRGRLYVQWSRWLLGYSHQLYFQNPTKVAIETLLEPTQYFVDGHAVKIRPKGRRHHGYLSLLWHAVTQMIELVRRLV